MNEPAVIHEASDWLVLNKPAGWHTAAPSRRRAGEIKERGGAIEPHIEGWLRERFDWARTLDEAGLVHRLDVETTGCLVVAKTAGAHARLRDLVVHSPGVGKTYLAEVQFSSPAIASRGSFRLYFSSRYKRSKKVTVEDEGDARYEGRCEWRVISQTADAARLEVELIGPGRRHQIRAGLAHLGFPILGDALYGGPASRDGLLHLHASRVEFEEERVECGPPW
jgi:23S rRNA-/tRNA-specific pseudouridylate synthase